jgi:hypothetical protein
VSAVAEWVECIARCALAAGKYYPAGPSVAAAPFLHNYSSHASFMWQQRKPSSSSFKTASLPHQMSPDKQDLLVPEVCSGAGVSASLVQHRTTRCWQAQVRGLPLQSPIAITTITFRLQRNFHCQNCRHLTHGTGNAVDALCTTWIALSSTASQIPPTQAMCHCRGPSSTTHARLTNRITTTSRQ